MIQATVGETWGSTVQQGCVDAMKSTPDQFSLHSHIRTTLQTLCLTFSVCLVTVRLSLSPCLGSQTLVLSPDVSLLVAPFTCLLRGLLIRRLPIPLLILCGSFIGSLPTPLLILFIRIFFLFTVIVFFLFGCFYNNELIFVSSLI